MPGWAGLAVAALAFAAMAPTLPWLETPASRLEGAINDLRRIELAGGFVPVPEAATLRPGDRSPAVP